MAMITRLNEKAMLVKLTTRRANLTRRDEYAEQMIQSTLDDASLVVSSKLFRDQTNPINQIVSSAGRVYVFHRKNTHPFIDRGPRVLVNMMYDEYTGGMRGEINSVDNQMAKHMPTYDDHVQQDIDWRSRQAKLSGKEPRAQVSDYPTAHEFRTAMSFDFRFMPLPSAKHFVYDISDEDEAKFEATMADLSQMVTNNTVAQMLKPLKHLAETLAVPIGATDPATGKRLGIFRDSAVENVVEGLELAKKLAIDPSPELQASMHELDEKISYWAEKQNWLRESPVNREAAARQLSHIANQMSAYMTGV